MVDQRERVRAQTHCVACDTDDKPVGLLLHWACHNAQKRRNGDYNKAIERKLDELERSLGGSQ
jgi:hypothetical protein